VVRPRPVPLSAASFSEALCVGAEVYRAAGALMSAISPMSRHSRCTKRQAPCTPSSVQITSRSGGESDSMNQRAVSAP